MALAALSLTPASVQARPAPRRVLAADPFTTPAARQVLASTAATVTAAVADLDTGQVWIEHPAVRSVTASIVKVDILETLLYQAQQAGRPLSGAVVATARGMIEASDNDDATALWNLAGGSAGVAAYDGALGLTETVPDPFGAWGLTTTSAADQLLLLRALVVPNGLLDEASQDFQLALMQSVEAGQNWGVSGGIPAGVTVALKNGWLPLSGDSDWEINSIGRIKGDGRRYLIAVLTTHDPSEAAGIDTIEDLSGIVWRDLHPPPAKRRRPSAAGRSGTVGRADYRPGGWRTTKPANSPPPCAQRVPSSASATVSNRHPATCIHTWVVFA